MDSASNITINIIEPGSDVPVPDTGLFTHGIGSTEASIIATVSIIVLLVIATFFIVRKKKRLHIAKPSKRTSFFLGLLAIITSISTFTGLTLNSIYNHTNAKEGDLTVTTEDANLTIEVGDEPVFAVLPVDVKVEEAAPAGYTLTAYADNTDLVSTTDDTNIIPMVATSEGELAALKDNTYGLSLSLAKPTSKDEVVYTSLSTAADNPTFITDKDYKATEANDATTVYYGFYITPDIPYGTYKSSDIYYNATTNSSKVIFHGNGLYFNNNPEQTTNDVEYITGITEKTAKYSHTPNMDDEGNVSGNIPFGTQVNRVLSIPGASSLHIEYSYRGGLFPNYGNYLGGYASFWEGSHPDYSPNNNYTLGVQSCGASEVKDGRYYSDNNSELMTVECVIPGDTVTFGYWAQGGGPGSYAAPYGYYAIVTGYDADGNIIYLPGNTQVGGEYQDPSQDLPYIFLGWNEDKEATTATYESKNDIEINLPLTKGKTTELYAIWQHATKIHLDGNGSTSGEIPDKLLKPGEGTSLCGYYYSRDGYIFNNWNTKPDGSGESYGQCYWYTAPADQSVELNLYAQWSPATTIVYDGNGGEGNKGNQTIRAGDTQNIWGNWGDFFKEGYAWANWNTEPDGSGTTYNEWQEFTASDQSTVITLYTQWSPATTIVYDGNGYDWGGMGKQTVYPGNTEELWNNDYHKNGYYFTGWNTQPDGSGTSYNNYQSITASDQPTAITLYAQWTPEGEGYYTAITFNGNGADGGEMQDQIIAAGQTIETACNSYWKDGYYFLGWNTESDGSGTFYDNCAWYQAPSDKSETITLYAQWVGPTTITFNGNGSDGGSGLEDRYLAPGEGTNFCNDDNYTRTDYYFLGWNTESDGSGTFYDNCAWYQAPSDKSETITLYAQWTDKAMLDTGTTVNAKLKRLAGNSSAEYYTEDTNVATIARASALPADFTPTNDNTISMDGSATPVYAWYDADTTIIYYYTESDEIIMNPNSSNMFRDFRNLSDAISIADWNTSNVTNMSRMFLYAGRNATTFSLDLSSWDTSKVTDMYQMFLNAGQNATTWSIGDLSSWDTSKVTNMSQVFRYAGYNATTWSIGDLSSWDTSKVTDMYLMFEYAGNNATTFSLDLSSWNTSKVTDMSLMFENAGQNATTWSIGDLSSWDTSKVTDMSRMFSSAGSNATTWSIGDLSSWDTSKVTNMSQMFSSAGSNATTWSIGDLSSWDTSKVTNMRYMFFGAGSNATTFSLDLSSWNTSKVTDMYGMFYYAGQNATTWSVTIPPKTGDIENTTSAFYGQNSSIYADPPYDKFFTLAAQTNPNTANTTGTPNRYNSSGNRSAYTTESAEDIEDTEDVDDTDSDATSTPSRQEPLGEHQSSTTISTEDTSIVIPILIAASITLGTFALVLLAYKSRRREDE